MMIIANELKQKRSDLVIVKGGRKIFTPGMGRMSQSYKFNEELDREMLDTDDDDDDDVDDKDANNKRRKRILHKK